MTYVFVPVDPRVLVQHYHHDLLVLLPRPEVQMLAEWVSKRVASGLLWIWIFSVV